MTEELAYPSLRCVLEYMDPCKRIHIASRSPGIRRFNKSIPLHLTQLNITDSQIQVNNTSFNMEVYQEDLEDITDPRMHPVWYCYQYLTLEFKNEKEKSVIRRLPDGIEPEDCIRRLMIAFLGYKEVYVGNLNIDFKQPMEYWFPKQLRLRPRNLETQNFDLCLPIIDFSTPLEKIKSKKFPLNFHLHPIVTTAKTLIIDTGDSFPSMVVLRKLTNPNIELYQAFRENDEILELVDEWMRSGRPIETSFVIHLVYEIVARELLLLIMERFGGDFRILNAHLDDSGGAQYCLSIPLAVNSELNIGVSPSRGLATLKLEVKEKGTAERFRLALILKDEEEKEKEKKREEEKEEKKWQIFKKFCLIFLLFLFWEFGVLFIINFK